MQTMSTTSVNPTKALLMVVDDDELARAAASMVLTARGFRVEEHASAQSALEALEHGQQPDLILLDLMMPSMDGWEFRRRQLADTALADIPVVAISGTRSARASTIDAAALLAKPLVADELLGVVQGVLGEHKDETSAVRRLRHGTAASKRALHGRARRARSLSSARVSAHGATVLEEEQRREQLALVARAISHVVNNATQGLMSYAQCYVLQDDAESAQLQRATFAGAADCAAVLRRFSISTARGEAELPAPLDSVPTWILEEWRQRCPAPVELRVYGLHLLVQARVTSELLLSATNELITNAVEARRQDRGTVSVRVSHKRFRRRTLRTALPVCNRRSGSWCCLDVTDDGRGIAAADLPKIWWPFYSTKFADRGLGLSELLAKVAAQGGLVDARSTVGVGTTVRLLFPRDG